MSQRQKSADTDKQMPRAGAVEKSREPKGVSRAEAETRAWASVNKRHSGGNKIAARRKVPSGPIGGSGRKTNLARSS